MKRVLVALALFAAIPAAAEETVAVRTRADAVGDVYRFRSESRYAEKNADGQASQHNTQVFEESARVPLIVVLPKEMRAGKPAVRIASLVDLTDIAPTVLDIFGLSGTGGTAREFQGTSLLTHLEGDAASRGRDSREVFTRTVWERPIYALRNSAHTFIYNAATAEFSLFDRASNPRLEGKDHDYAPRAPIALRETYRQSLLAWVARQKKGAVVADTATIVDPVACEQMKALGYLSASYPCPTK